MFDHVKFGVSDYAASKAFFLKALEPLGVTVITEGMQRLAALVVRPSWVAFPGTGVLTSGCKDSQTPVQTLPPVVKVTRPIVLTDAARIPESDPARVATSSTCLPRSATVPLRGQFARLNGRRWARDAPHPAAEDTTGG